jgi:DNA-binding NarL/FixJ family response regulator
MIRVVLVDDQADFRRIVRVILSRNTNIEIVGEAGDGIEALELVEQLRPDVVLMDVWMPLLDGVAATKQLRIAYPDVQVLLFTSGDHDGYVLEGVRAGAVGYLLKNAQREVLVAAIRCASEGRSLHMMHEGSAGYLLSQQRG